MTHYARADSVLQVFFGEFLLFSGFLPDGKFLGTPWTGQLLNFQHGTADRAELSRGRVRRRIAESAEKFYVFRFFSCVGVFVSYNYRCRLGGPRSARIPQKFFLPLGSRESGVVFTVPTVLTVGELFRRARKPRRQQSKRYVPKVLFAFYRRFQCLTGNPSSRSARPLGVRGAFNAQLGRVRFCVVFR